MISSILYGLHQESKVYTGYTENDESICKMNKKNLQIIHKNEVQVTRYVLFRIHTQYL